MTPVQIMYTQQIIIEFLQEQLASDPSTDKKKAQINIEEINKYFGMLSDPSSPDPDRQKHWINFFKDLMDARVTIYDKTPTNTRSIFGDALNIVHTFLWSTLQKSTFKNSIDEASEVAIIQYRRFLNPAYLGENQEILEEKRINAAAFNNENIFNNYHSSNQNNMPRQQDAQYTFNKKYPAALYTITTQMEHSINELERKLQELLCPPAISTAQLISMHAIFVEFLIEHSKAEKKPNAQKKIIQEKKNACVARLNQNFDRLIAKQTSTGWATLLQSQMEDIMAFYPDAPPASSTIVEYEFCDALQAIHTCLLKMLDKYMLNSSCKILDTLKATKNTVRENARNLNTQPGSEPEAIEKALILEAAFWDEVKPMPRENPNKKSLTRFLFPNKHQKNLIAVRLDTWIDELEQKLELAMIPALQETALGAAAITSVASTLYPNVTVRNKRKAADATEEKLSRRRSSSAT